MMNSNREKDALLFIIHRALFLQEVLVTRLRFLVLLLLTLSLRSVSFGVQGASSPAPQESPWAELLKSPNADTRARAARDIGQSGDASQIPALTATLADPSVKVRKEVVIALARIHGSKSIDGLIQATKDPDSDVRVLAVNGLVYYYTGQNIETGVTGLFKKGYHQAKSHFETDVTQVEPGAQVDPKIDAALDATMNDTRSIEPARAAAHGLGVLLARSTVPDLIKAAHSADEDLAREALNALSKIKDLSAGPQLIDLLDSTSTGTLEDAAVTVGVLRVQAAAPKLRSIYENNSDKKVRANVLQGLADLGDRASVPLFTGSLVSNDKATRALGAEGLGRAGDTKPVPELEKAVAAETDVNARLAMDFALTALGSNNYRNGLVQGLDSRIHGDIALTYLIELARNPKIQASLYPYLASGTDTERRKLCDVLMYSGNQSSLGPLESASHDRNDDVATEALHALHVIRARLSAGGSGLP
jgi:HEAT repeat protein